MAVSHVKSDTIADFTGTITGFDSQGSTITIAATDLVRPVDWNSAHNQFYTLTGNTTGNSTASGTNVILSGGSGITLSGATGSIGIHGFQPGTVSHYPFPVFYNLSTASMNSGTTAATGGSSQTTQRLLLAPMVVMSNIHYNQVRAYVSGNTAAGTGSVSGAHMYGIYTLNAGTAFSLSTSYIFNYALSQSSVTAHSIRIYWGTNSTSNSTSWGGNSSASMTGFREILLSDGVNTLTNGLYYVVYGCTDRTSNAAVARISVGMVASVSTNIGGLRLGANTTGGVLPRWLGVFTTTSNGTTTGPTVHVMPASIHTSVLTTSGGSSVNLWPNLVMVST